MHAFPTMRPQLFIAILSATIASPASAGVVVISNRSAVPVRLTTLSTDAQQSVALKPAELTSLVCGPSIVVRWKSGESTGERELDADAAYFFYQDQDTDEMRLEPIGLVRDAEPIDDDETAIGRISGTPGGMTTFTVKLLADEEEAATRKLWEARFRERLKSASAVFEHYCRVRFETVAVENWKSNDALNDFEEALADFRARVPLGPARLAIGFTSQYEVPQGRTHLGGTYGPLATHILLREWSQHLSEAERLELLVHELGHFLGAVHSVETDSVMRPVLGDKQAAAKRFRVQLDPLNTLAICLVSEECRITRIATLRDLSRPTRRRLADIYRILAELQPEDPAAPQYYGLLTGELLAGLPRTDTLDEGERSGNQTQRVQSPKSKVQSSLTPPLGAGPGLGEGLPTSPGGDQPKGTVKRPALTPNHQPRQLGAGLLTAPSGPLIESTQQVLAAMVAAAEENRRKPKGRQAGGEDLFRRKGDELTAYYVRSAAIAAADVPQEYRKQAFLIALAIGLESSSWLREVPILGGYLRDVEPDARRSWRLDFLGQPTMRGRDDLTQHFMISAAITALAGARSAESAGVGKELRDSDGGSGFSFSDLCADLAGIEFAERIQSGKLPINRLARRFRVADYLPDVSGLADGLSQQEFAARYGSTSDPRFAAICEKLRDRIAQTYHGAGSDD